MIAAYAAKARAGACAMRRLRGPAVVAQAARAASTVAAPPRRPLVRPVLFTGPPPRVAVGLSGGVDSAVTAALLLERGFEVVGVFMRNWDAGDEAATGGSGDCTASADYASAGEVAAYLGIPLRHVSLTSTYWNAVFEPFLSEYAAGRTPNPDVLCNRYVKMGAFREMVLKPVYGEGQGQQHQLQQAEAPPPPQAAASSSSSSSLSAQAPSSASGYASTLGLRWADFIATGHYATVWPPVADVSLAPRASGGPLLASPLAIPPEHLDGHPTGPRLLSSLAASKDQSDFLAAVPGAALKRIMMPLGGATKAQVRDAAAGLHLPNAGRRDSYGFCFIGERPLAAFLGDYMPLTRAAYVDLCTGAVVGETPAAECVTVGQNARLSGAPCALFAAGRIGVGNASASGGAAAADPSAAAAIDATAGDGSALAPQPIARGLDGTGKPIPPRTLALLTSAAKAKAEKRASRARAAAAAEAAGRVGPAVFVVPSSTHPALATWSACVRLADAHWWTTTRDDVPVPVAGDTGGGDSGGGAATLSLPPELRGAVAAPSPAETAVNHDDDADDDGGGGDALRALLSPPPLPSHWRPVRLRYRIRHSQTDFGVAQAAAVVRRRDYEAWCAQAGVARGRALAAKVLAAAVPPQSAAVSSPTTGGSGSSGAAGARRRPPPPPLGEAAPGAPAAAAPAPAAGIDPRPPIGDDSAAAAALLALAGAPSSGSSTATASGGGVSWRCNDPPWRPWLKLPASAAAGTEAAAATGNGTPGGADHGDEWVVALVFDRPQLAVMPGQSLVLYSDGPLPVADQKGVPVADAAAAVDGGSGAVGSGSGAGAGAWRFAHHSVIGTAPLYAAGPSLWDCGLLPRLARLHQVRSGETAPPPTPDAADPRPVVLCR